MAVYLSPGVYTQILDLSLYIPNLSTTIAGMVGMASKGPLNEPIYVSNVVSFVTNFGQPNPNYMGPYAALQFLRYGRQLYYVRVAGPSAEYAEVAVPEAATAASVTGDYVGPFMVISSANNVLRVTVDGGPTTAVTLTKGRRTAAQVAAEIQAAVAGTTVTSANDVIKIATTTVGPAGSITIGTLGSGSTANATLGFPSPAGITGTGTAATAAVIQTSAFSPYTGISAGLGTDTLIISIDGDAPQTVTLTTGLPTPTAANIVTDINANPGLSALYGTQAEGTISLTGISVLGETFTVDSQLFTLVAARAVAGEVTQGASAAAQAINIAFAINADLTTVTAVAVGTTVVVTAVDGGTAGNAIVFTETLTDGTMDGAGFLGGTTLGANWTGASTFVSGLNTGVQITSVSVGETSTVLVSATPGASQLGFDSFLHKGADATNGTVTGTVAGPFVFGANNILNVRFEMNPIRPVGLTPGLRTTGQIIDDINTVIGPDGYNEGIATVTNDGRIKITSFVVGTLPVQSAVEIVSTGSGQYALGFDTIQHLGTGNPNMTSITVRALTKGTHGNALSVVAGVGTSVPDTFKLTIYDGERIAEVWDNLDLTPASVNYVETRINDVSTWIWVTDNTDPAAVEFPQTGVVYTMTGGDDGISDVTDADYIGMVTPGSKTGMQLFANAEDLDLNLLMVPGISSPAVINEMLLLCSTRGDAMCIVDPPLGLTVQQVVDWHNGYGAYSDHQAFNSLYGALYWPWLEIYDAVNRQKVWVPPSGLVSGVYAFTDYTTETWFAPAGLNRGHLLQPLRVEYSADLGERDLMYGNQNAVNPIVNFRRDGITVWGQRSLQRKPSALDRVNVVRLVLYLRKVIATAVKYLVFEPNDPITWATFVNLVEPYMESVKQRRGVLDYKVICDASTNPPDAMDRNEMHGIVALKPTKAAEFIEVTFAVTAQGVNFDDLTF